MRVGVKRLLGAGILVTLVGLTAVAFRSTAAPGPMSGAEDWTCSMHPQIHQPKPGKCPICGMDLVLVKQISASQDRLRERAGVETEDIGYRQLFKEIRTLGKIDSNERQVAFIASRVAGRVDRVHADFTGVPVKKGDHLVDIYSPDLFVGQTELIRAAEAVAKEPPGGSSFAQISLDAARTKLSLLGLLPEQLREIETSKKVQTHLTIYAPIGGTVVEKSIRAGQYVKEGDPLYRIVDLDPVWLFLDIYEYDLSWVRFGQKVNVSVEAFPGEAFPGVVTFLDPILDDKTRTVKARVNLPNPERKLRPGMYASASLMVRLQSDGRPEPTGLEGKFVCPMHPEIVREGPGKCSVCEMPLERVPGWRPATKSPPVPVDHTGHGEVVKEPAKQAAPEGMVLAVRATAVLDTGKRKVAYRVTKEGAYELVELEVGARAESKEKSGQTAAYYPIHKGLVAGDKVVVRGGFLLDSQRQIEGMPSLLFPKGQAGVNLHAGHGAPPPPANVPGKEPAHKH